MEHPDIKERNQFDLDHGVNTASGLARLAYRPIANLQQGHAYQPSWTSTVHRSFQETRKFLGKKFTEYSFVDVGCGKGKVNIIWQQELIKNGIQQRNVGVDYYEPLVTIARNNFKTVFGNPGEFYVGDAATHDFRFYGEKLIIYMFNPFSTMVMLPFLRNLKMWPTLLVYNVPSCHQIVTTNKFKVINDLTGPNQNQNITIYSNHH